MDVGMNKNKLYIDIELDPSHERRTRPLSPWPPAQPRGSDSMATEDHCNHCFDVLASHFTRAAIPPEAFPTDVQYPLFVTWNKLGEHGGVALRGCIGAFYRTARLGVPRSRGLLNVAGCLKPLPITSLKEYALTSALRDTRFNPIAASELPYLHCAHTRFHSNRSSSPLRGWPAAVCYPDALRRLNQAPSRS